jgi:hypothetical protein
MAAPEIRAKADPAAVLVIGDSQAQGVAGALQRLYLRSREFHVLDRSKIGTGLNAKLTYDWNASVEDLVKTEHADVAVVMFGTNDRPAIRTGGAIDPTREQAFAKTYAIRVGNIVKTLRQAHIPVIWLGDPIVKDADYADDMKLLNGIMEPAATAEGAQFLPLWALSADETGAYAAYGKALDGQTKRLRADDGVHFTPTGYDLIAARLQPMLKAAIAAATTDQPAEADQTSTPPSAASALIQ